ncbi:hypothetical protein [Streptomyces sp. NPDC088789]|uniref:hypothetical protein n=1 Tax=Streptomyces sp. NPDC088789 TaxID=3365899 RepID=UPI0038309ABD
MVKAYGAAVKMLVEAGYPIEEVSLEAERIAAEGVPGTRGNTSTRRSTGVLTGRSSSSGSRSRSCSKRHTAQTRTGGSSCCTTMWSGRSRRSDRGWSWAAGDVLTDGKFTLDQENGLTLEVDWNVRAANMPVARRPWSDPESDPIADELRWIQHLDDVGVPEPEMVLTSRMAYSLPEDR